MSAQAENRHRTAMVRGVLSRPVQLAADLGLVTTGGTFFDYGCGHGDDVEGLARAGVTANGWDPHFRPDVEKASAEVVNLGYVINVIPDPSERRDAVLDAWELTEKALVVSARLNGELRTVSKGRPHGDGFITGHGTFQKFYSQGELRSWLDTVLESETVAIAPGIFVAFKAEAVANEFLMRTRPRRRHAAKVSRSDRIYDEHRESIDALMEFYSERGRLPSRTERPDLQAKLKEAAGSLRRAWRVAVMVTPETDWDTISAERRLDLLVDLALLKLNRRPTFTALPETTRYDVRGLIGSYKQATAEADQLLFSTGDSQVVAGAADESPVGKRLPTSLYVHESALPDLPHVLRVYEGCARWLVGEVDGANIIKLATNRPKVSYLEYPAFDKDPHPVLHRTTFVRIGALDVDERDYTSTANPPILHRKETFVASDYPSRQKFARLTAQEERFGLFDTDTRTIGNLRGWQERLSECGVALRGHRVVRVKSG
ncbi:MAG: DNA phosphorothioation-associated putative methyltransferase [Acidimicrobiaceae bacterium]|nr:DNA phosphorothioation-associated putative methyltransferase [Acidimicrobiaceae bacterium]MXW74914.1 DNA phosphorothioation-associated putative methyltransferase [Acidimicrobiaceae bacterium]MYD06717.1 DNA phosphorothioation-associated putative methyltransferase [Acidimicrobiaceae bacterium]MYI58937.1 DNA phosphorothioation-associated putative methyltransferase [Acidimicrobiaceae bacterium]